MVEHADAHELADIRQTARQLLVFHAGTGVAAGMVVEKDDRSRRLFDRRKEGFSGVNEACRQTPFRDGDIFQDLMLRIQENRLEDFAAEMLEARLKMAHDIHRTRDLDLRGGGLGGESFPQLK